MVRKRASRLLTKGDLDTVMGAMKADFDSGMRAVRTDFDASVKRLDDKIDSAADRLDRKINGVIVELVKTQGDVREIKETMATKDDIGRVLSAIDAFAGKAQSYDRARTLHGQSITELQIAVKGHEDRITALESRTQTGS